MKVVAILICMFFSLGVVRVEAASSLPITGTFYMSDIVATKAQIRQIMTEMKASGIDTVIVLASGDLSKTNNVFSEMIYYNNPDYNFSRDILSLAQELNMKLFVGLASADPSQINISDGSPTDINTNQGRLIDFSGRLVEATEKELVRQGLPNDLVVGYYIGQEAWPGMFSNIDSPTFIYYKKLSEKIKQLAPTKKILISPYVYNTTSYDQLKNEYQNVYKSTAIDIIALQDSIGSGKVTTSASNLDHFRALKDAKLSAPNKEAWANIETFEAPAGDWNYNPAVISRIVSQVDTAKPYVSKMITWIYQHTMLSDPTFDTFNSWSKQYTLEKAVARKKLREDYLKHYTNTCSTKFFYIKGEKQCATTSSTYNSDGFECNNENKVTCESNLTKYVPNSTGVCFASFDQCQKDNGLGQACERKYYFNKVSNQCLITSSTYNSDGFECNKTEKVSCESNLTKYMPDSTGKCFSDLEQCKRENILPVTNIPGDFNGDKVVNLVDFGVWKGKYAKGEFSLVEFTIWKKAYLGK